MDFIHGRYPWMRGPWGTFGAPIEQTEKNQTQDETLKTRWRKNGLVTHARLNERGMSPGPFSMGPQQTHHLVDGSRTFYMVRRLVSSETLDFTQRIYKLFSTI